MIQSGSFVSKSMTNAVTFPIIDKLSQALIVCNEDYALLDILLINIPTVNAKLRLDY